MVYNTYYNSPVGKLRLVSDGSSLIGLFLENQKYFCDSIKEDLVKNDDVELFKLTKNWLDMYFNNEMPKISALPLAPRGSSFRQEVWKILCDIPYGKTTTYKDIAIKMAKIEGKEKMSAQAIGGAIGHNPISIIIPCHRVVGTNGNLTGYAGGIDIKEKLLNLEKLNNIIK